MNTDRAVDNPKDKRRRHFFVLLTVISLALTRCSRSEDSLRSGDIVQRHPAVVALEQWWMTDSGKKNITPDWNNAEIGRTSGQKCGHALASLMKGMEFFQVTLAGNLQNLVGDQDCWQITVPVQGNLTGYNARAIVGIIDANDHRILAVYAPPEP